MVCSWFLRLVDVTSVCDNSDPPEVILKYLQFLNMLAQQLYTIPPIREKYVPFESLELKRACGIGLITQVRIYS